MHELSVKRGWDSADLDRLAREASAGDAAAFEALVRHVFRLIHRWALVRLGDRDDADDVTQRVLVGLRAKLGSWEGRGRFTTWLYRVTANEASSWSRRAARRSRRARRFSEARAEEDEGGYGGPEDLDRKRLLELVRSHFLALPPRQREVLDLVDFQGYTPRETADMLEMNANTVRANLFKARRSLRARVLEELPEAGESLP